MDMEKLADSLQRLGEDDLLRVVEMVHDHKSPDTYTKNDVEREHIRLPIGCNSEGLMSATEGEFHVDLYTLPDNLVTMLWDFCQQKL